MDPKSTWALGEFRKADMELKLLGDRIARSNSTRQETSQRSAMATLRSAESGSGALKPQITYQGERLTGQLVVKFQKSIETGEVDELECKKMLARWRQFGRELNVEIEITTEAASAATTAGEASSSSMEEPSLWREYEGRENARDRGVLYRNSRCVRPQPVSSRAAGDDADGSGEVIAYTLPIEVQVPVDYVGRPVVLEALVSPAPPTQPGSRVVGGEGEGTARGVGSPPNEGGVRAGVGGAFSRRLDDLFALSRMPSVRLPVKRCVVPLLVVQPIAVSSTSSSTPSPSPSLGLGRCLVALEVRNEHPTASVTLYDVEAHVDGTARSGDRASQKLTVISGRGGGGSGSRGRRRRILDRGGSGPRGMEEAQGSVMQSGQLEGLEGAITQSPAGVAGDLEMTRVSTASWVAKPTLPLILAPGDVQGMVLALSPDPVAEPLLPRREGGLFETPVTFVWGLEYGEAGVAPEQGKEVSSKSTPKATTSVHLARWRAEERARDEVVVRVRGQPKVKLNDVFEVSLLARNLSPGARDLVVMFTEEPSTRASATTMKKFTPERMRGAAGGPGVSRDTVGEGEESAPEEDERDADEEEALDVVSPLGSPMKGRGTGHRRTSSQGTMVAAYGPTSSVSRASSGAVPTGTPVGNPAAAGSGSHTSAVTSFGDVIPLDSAVPLGRLECGAEGAATVRLTSARSGLAQLSTLCLRDTITGAIYVPTHPYEVFVE